MDLKYIQKPVKKLLEETDSHLRKGLRSDIHLVKKLSSDTPSTGGKKIRATLLFLLAGMNDALAEELPYIASCIEMFHLSSLIHDDVVDNSRLRRGQKTLNVNFGHYIPVLWGDFLFINALNSLNRVRNQAIMNIVLNAALLMIKGQIIEAENSFNTRIQQKTYMEIIQKKTSALFAGVAEIAAAIKGDSAADSRLFYEFGLHFGTIFQISDDMIDIFSKKSGKDRFRDLKEGKITLPYILLLKKSKRDVLKNSAELDQDLFLELLEEHGIKELSLKEINRYHEKCLDFLRRFPDSVYKDSLQELLEFVKYRDY